MTSPGFFVVNLGAVPTNYATLTIVSPEYLVGGGLRPSTTEELRTQLAGVSQEVATGDRGQFLVMAVYDANGYSEMPSEYRIVTNAEWAQTYAQSAVSNEQIQAYIQQRRAERDAQRRAGLVPRTVRTPR